MNILLSIIEKKINLWMLASCTFTSLFLISSTSAYGTERPMDRFYLGGDVGYSKHKIQGFAETFPPNYQALKRTNLNIDDSNMFLRVNAGYGHYWNDQLFTGIEVGYQKLLNSNNYKLTNTAIGHQVDVEYNSRYDVGLLLGCVVFSNDLAYIRLGYGVTDVDINPHDIGGTGGSFHDLKGPIYGIGYSRMLDNQLGIRFEINRLSIDDSYNNDKNDGERYDTTIKDLEFQVGILYHF